MSGKFFQTLFLYILMPQQGWDKRSVERVLWLREDGQRTD